MGILLRKRVSVLLTVRETARYADSGNQERLLGGRDQSPDPHMF
jgi:hypothetical protein